MQLVTPSPNESPLQTQFCDVALPIQVASDKQFGLQAIFWLKNNL